MTIHEIATQLHRSSLGGFFNGEKFTKYEFETYIRRMMRDAEHNKIPNRIVMEICLPDGRWLFTVDKFSDSADGYDYYIPDTREQENRIKELLFN